MIAYLGILVGLLVVFGSGIGSSSNAAAAGGSVAAAAAVGEKVDRLVGRSIGPTP